ncbi:amidohydrolase family protein [Vibrio algarum]|uniref:Amidohydrolase family protein n=1 Tax=Vibrio algarum TaxID=3020714 RepID=A0ABT4YU88_9VIBR|nr:amidohydrolase family protein [Vibrio sp. KJ40-1]MDB1124937.1 amidohydrolase family protein [Vibrio sp. KJ40-1]
MGYLIKNADSVYLTNQGKTGHLSTDIRIREGIISEIGTNLRPSVNETESVIDASNCVIYPGFVNTHHHLAQSVLKGVPEGLNKGLGEWLAAVPYRFWPKIPPNLMYLSAKLGLYELIRSGTTTCADHHYLYHENTSDELEQAVWQAAEDMGVRFSLCRGSATATGNHKGMKSLNIQPESLDRVLDKMTITRSQQHDSSPYSMKKLCVAPTSLIHSAPQNDLIELSRFARKHKLKMHSHLLEVEFDQAQAKLNHQISAVEYAANSEWLGEDVWFAHLVKADQAAISILAETKTGMSHCPTSNCRLGSGISPAYQMDEKGMTVSMGVDGSASSESGSMLQELNLAWLLQRSQNGAERVTVDKVVQWGSENGAKILGLKTGKIEIGYAADLVLYRVDEPRVCTVHERLLAPVMCGEPMKVYHSFINGKPIITKGEFTQLDTEKLCSDLQQEMTKFLAQII